MRQQPKKARKNTTRKNEERERNTKKNETETEKNAHPRHSIAVSQEGSESLVARGANLLLTPPSSLYLLMAWFLGKVARPEMPSPYFATMKASWAKIRRDETKRKRLQYVVAM